MSKYQEIQRLHAMLTEAGIEHEWIDLNPERPSLDFLGQKIDWGWQIIVYRPDGERLVSAIEGHCTYGAVADRIEIMGLTSKDEGKVCGWLTAEQVFARIQHWRAEHGTEKG